MTRRRKPRRRSSPIPIIIAIAILAAVLLGLLLFAAQMDRSDDTPNTTVPSTSQSPNTTAPSETTQPTSGIAPVDDPEDPGRTGLENDSVQSIMRQYAQEHGFSYWDYPRKIVELYEKNPETAEFCLNYPLLYDQPGNVDMSQYEDVEGVPLFMQWDTQWGYFDYGGELFALSGCAPTSLAMAGYYFTRDPDMNPLALAQFAMDNGYRILGSGTVWAFISEGAEELGLNSRTLGLSERSMVNALENGELIIVNFGAGVFTDGGHYVLVVGYEDGKFIIHDCNSYERTNRRWDFEEFSDQVRNLWAISG